MASIPSNDRCTNPQGNHPFDRSIHCRPTHTEHRRRFLPGKPACPVPKKLHHHGCGIRTLSVTPRNRFHNRPMHRTGHPPLRIMEIDRNPPKGWKSPFSLRKMIVSRTEAVALGALALPLLVRFDANIETQPINRFGHAFIRKRQNQNNVAIGSR